MPAPHFHRLFQSVGGANSSVVSAFLLRAILNSMLFFSAGKMGIVGIALVAGVCAFAQPARNQAGPKLKAIWEPVNIKEDVDLQTVHFTSPEEGWVAGGRTVMQGGVILHTVDGGASW